jgi:hypothetical protein
MTAPVEPFERTALYRIRNAGGDLLYIGISERPEYRWYAHRRTHSWWSEVAQFALEWHDTRAAAEVAEAAAIVAEVPRYNSTYNYSVPFDRRDWEPILGESKDALLTERILTEIRSGRWAVGYRIPSFEVLIEAASVSRSVVKRVVQSLRAQGVLDWRPGDGTYVTSVPQ